MMASLISSTTFLDLRQIANINERLANLREMAKMDIKDLNGMHEMHFVIIEDGTGGFLNPQHDVLTKGICTVFNGRFVSIDSHGRTGSGKITSFDGTSLEYEVTWSAVFAEEEYNLPGIDGRPTKGPVSHAGKCTVISTPSGQLVAQGRIKTDFLSIEVQFQFRENLPDIVQD